MPRNDIGSGKTWSLLRRNAAEENNVEALERRLRSKELPLWEDAEGLARFLQFRGLSQAEGARLLGRSQAAVANRLRLLRLPEDVRGALRAAGAAERHARALLRLPDPEDQRKAAAVVLRRMLSVAETEDLVEALLSPAGAAAELYLEQREAVNEIWASLSRLRDRCPELEMEIRSREGCVEILLRLPRK